MSPSEITFKRQWWVQEAIDDLVSETIGVSAGLGSGKTHGACDFHDDRSLLNSECRFSCFAMPIYQKIHDAAIPTFKKLFDSLGRVEGVDYKFLKNPNPKLVYLDSGHEVHFISANRPDKIVAVEYSHATASESGSLDREAIELIETRIRDPKSQALQFMMEGAPQGITFFAERFDDQGNPDWQETAKRVYYNDEMKSRRFRLTSYDNPFLPPGYVPRLQKIYKGNAPYIQSYIYGIFCPLAEGNAYGNYNSGYDIEDLDPEPYSTINFCWDFNANPLAWVVLQDITFEEYGYRRQRHVAIHESEGTSSQLDDACIEFYKKFPVERFANTKIKLYGDSSGHARSHKIRDTDYERIRRYLAELGYRNIEVHALKYNPKETVTVEALNSFFSNDNHYICKRCVNYRRSLISTRWRDGEKKLDKPSGEDWSHWSDAVKYFAYTVQQSGTTITSRFI